MWILDKSKWWLLACFDRNKSENHRTLGELIAEFSNRTGAKVEWCGPDATEMIALPINAVIVDRSVLADGIYNLFLEYCEKVNDNQPVEVDGENCAVREDMAFINIDGDTSLTCPKLPIVMSLDLSDERAIPLIMRTLELLRITHLQSSEGSASW